MTGRKGSQGRAVPSGVRPHIPVLLPQVLAALVPRDGEAYLDGTFGAGGYSAAILEAAQCRVLGLDRDLTAVAASLPLCQRFPGRLTVVNSVFSAMDRVWQKFETSAPDGIVLDIGVSSMQLDHAERGFSFQTDGPLDMRMGQDGESAADILNTYKEEDIASILWRYGDERRSRHIAHAIVMARAETPIARTLELGKLVEKVIGRKPGDPKHPATRTFQALRIAVNHELEELTAALDAAERLLNPGGRLVVVTFHSLEDRIVKDFLRERSERAAKASRHLPEQLTAEPSFQIVNQRALSPSEEEIASNPRARSAKLRAAIRTRAPGTK